MLKVLWYLKTFWKQMKPKWPELWTPWVASSTDPKYGFQWSWLCSHPKCVILSVHIDCWTLFWCDITISNSLIQIYASQSKFTQIHFVVKCNKNNIKLFFSQTVHNARIPRIPILPIYMEYKVGINANTTNCVCL